MENPQNIWIVGSGHYGVISAKGVLKKWPAARLTIIDYDPDACVEVSELGDECVVMEGVAYLYQNLIDASQSPDWIIPVIPVHVAYEWIMAMLAETHRFTQHLLPDDFLNTLPNAMRGADGSVYLSNADFICPETCSEPDRLCTATQMERPRIMHEYLLTIDFNNYRSHVIRSRQLCPGVGGFRPQDLFEALEAVRNIVGPALVSTACSCHGVMHAFEIQRR